VVKEFNLRTERRNRGLTLQRAAREIGVADHVLQRAETGATPHPDNAARIAAFYGRKVAELWPR